MHRHSKSMKLVCSRPCCWSSAVNHLFIAISIQVCWNIFFFFKICEVWESHCCKPRLSTLLWQTKSQMQDLLNCENCFLQNIPARNANFIFNDEVGVLFWFNILITSKSDNFIWAPGTPLYSSATTLKEYNSVVAVVYFVVGCCPCCILIILWIDLYQRSW